MNNPMNPARASAAGTCVMMACSCGAAASSVKLLALGGIGVTSMLIHPLFLGVGAALILSGLWRMARESAYVALIGFMILGFAFAVTPPSVMTMVGGMASENGGMAGMSSVHVPWGSWHMFGASLYVVGAAVLGYAFWRAIPSRKPAASALGIGGMALAAGCTCCLVDGAVAGMMVTAGASTLFETIPFLFWTGLAVSAFGLYRLGGLNAAKWVPAGGLIIKYAPTLMKTIGPWKVAGVDLQFLPNYMLTLVGVGVILYGFAVAYRTVPVRAEPFHGGLVPAV